MSYMRASFVYRRPASSVGDLKQSRYSASIERVLYTPEDACRYKKFNGNGGHNVFALYNARCKTYAAYHALIASIFSQALLQEKFYVQMVTFIQSRSLELH